MCGIFAYHGATCPDPGLLEAAALEAARRGPHGHGWAGRRPDGTYTEHRQLGPLNSGLAALRATRETAVLGHARLATFGAHDDSGGLQPVTLDGHAIAHNGNVYNAAQLAGGHETDTQSLAAAYAALRAEGTSPGSALTAVIGQASQEAWAVVVLDAAGGALYAHRRYHPLYQLRTPAGLYLSSRPFHGHCELLPEDQALTLTGD